MSKFATTKTAGNSHLNGSCSGLRVATSEEIVCHEVGALRSHSLTANKIPDIYDAPDFSRLKSAVNQNAIL